MPDDGTRAAAPAAIDSLADVAGGGAADLGERAATPEFMMVRALAIEAFYSDFVALDGEDRAPGRRSTSSVSLASQIKHDWSYLGTPG